MPNQNRTSTSSSPPSRSRGLGLEGLAQDLRFGARVLRKNPGFTAIAVLTLALGIGANTAVFSIVDAVLLRPLPYKDSSRMALVTTHTAMFRGLALGNCWPAYQQIHDSLTAFEQTAVYDNQPMTLTQAGQPEQLNVSRVSDAFFEELGTRAQLGRLLLPEDQQSGHEQVVVLSDKLWRTRFGADPNIVGRTLILDEKPHAIVGVAPKGFAYLHPQGADVWMPFVPTAEERTSFTYFSFQVLGKLKKGETLEQAQSQLNTIAPRIAAQEPMLRQGYELRAQMLMENAVGDVRKAYWLLLGAATLVLLIACSNIASLALARGWARQREMALRVALGASRGRIVRQVLAESLLLAVLGGLAGALLAANGVNLFRAIAPADTARLEEISVNTSLLWFALATAVAAGLIFGFAPARRAASADPNFGLKQGAQGAVTGTGSARRPRFGGVLVVAEIALAFVLLIGAGLVTQSLVRILRVNTGMRTDHLLTFDLELLPPGVVHPDMKPAEAQSAGQRATENLRQTLGAIQAVPGVVGVAATDHQVLGGTMAMQGQFEIEGAIPPPSAAERVAYWRNASPSYFQLLAIPVLRGRAFTDQDLRGVERVAMANETMARQYWGTLEVLGKHISVTRDEKGRPEWIEIVGVVADTRDVLLEEKPVAEYYLPSYQVFKSNAQILVRTVGDPNALSSAISQAVWKVLPERPITHLMTMERIVSGTIGTPKLRAALLGTFAVIGLALALLGVYGVLAYAVARRTREIGIRMALGASPKAVLELVLGQGLALAAAGVLIGGAAALALARLLSSELYGVKPTDPLTFLGAAALMIAVACLACYAPAARAMRTDPLVALRDE